MRCAVRDLAPRGTGGVTVYDDRHDAAHRLLQVLPPLEEEDVVVLALPRGGVPIGAEIAESLHAPLDLILVRKVGAPRNPELAVAAVTGPGDAGLLVNVPTARAFGLSRSDIDALAASERTELERRRNAYVGGRAPLPLKGRTVLVVDDGVATGTTLRAALTALRNRAPARVIVAVPVASAEALETLRGLADAIICPEPQLRFGAVGAAYRVFDQVTDEEVIHMMQEANARGETKE
ncbi:putative phosphoribosyl transferase [Roseovarius halotolerans]|uniref:Putative phosphoribosyl transferase/MT0597 n=1 Tax=Roseovarius halotolerans TaxID=505353 RepID=A0A1X6YLX4_9RHOB|nr:putative phosphoribosyl transferase [Roseovarius halotolerans]SLN25318.1 Putative phosphoribosyl transferase/MT0597 [Roseovarius halotolerans]